MSAFIRESFLPLSPGCVCVCVCVSCKWLRPYRFTELWEQIHKRKLDPSSKHLELVVEVEDEEDDMVDIDIPLVVLKFKKWMW